MIAPLGLVQQLSIDADANRIEKWRLTHDQSFNVIRGSNRSVNDHLLTDTLTASRFGRAFLRHLHVIAHLRHPHPNKRILQTKVDHKSAYRRIHLAASPLSRPLWCSLGFCASPFARHSVALPTPLSGVTSPKWLPT